MLCCFSRPYKICSPCWNEERNEYQMIPLEETAGLLYAFKPFLSTASTKSTATRMHVCPCASGRISHARSIIRSPLQGLRKRSRYFGSRNTNFSLARSQSPLERESDTPVRCLVHSSDKICSETGSSIAFFPNAFSIDSFAPKRFRLSVLR